MNLKKLSLATFSLFALFYSSDIYAGRNGVPYGHLYNINYPSQQPKDTMGKPTIYVPDAKTDLDRDVPPGTLPQYMTPLYYGYKEIKFGGSASSNSNDNQTTPHYGAKVSKRHATKNSFQINHPDGIYYYRDGIFYLQKDDKYEIHEPHIGFRVLSIPDTRREYMSGDEKCYYYYGTFYSFNPIVKMYDVIVPPAGAIVDWIPENAEKKMIDGEICYVANGVKYKELSLSMGNSRCYQVIGEE